MVSYVYSPREHHNVASAAEYRDAHAKAIRKANRRGSRAEVHTVSNSVVARVDANSWLIDCECGAGNATDPEWGIACCFGCGAVHDVIEFPDLDTSRLIEDVLVERPNPMARFWVGETLVALAAKNVALDIDVPDAVVDAIAAAPLRQERQL